MKKRLLTIIVILLNIQSCFAIDSAIWQTYVDFNYQLDVKKQSIIDKQNVFLFYEIYDSLWRKYGYRYVEEPYTQYYDAKFEIKSNSSSSDIEYILKKYDSEIKSGNYSNISRELSNLGSKAEIKYTPAYTSKGYHVYTKPYVSEKRILNEAIQLYKKKMYITKPKPYSVYDEAKKYSSLKKINMQFIEDQFGKRMRTKKIDFENKKRIVIDDGYTFYWLNNKIQYDFNSDYIKPSVFYAVAKEVDLKFSKYYHQNLSIENYPYTNEYKSGDIHYIFDVEEKDL